MPSPAWVMMMPVTRDTAIQIGVQTLAAWHRQDHGDRCSCIEGEQFGYQMAAVIDALIAEGADFPVGLGTGKPTTGGPIVKP